MEEQNKVELHTLGEKVGLIFNHIDKNKDGKISKFELRYVMQGLDKNTWTNQKCDQLWNTIDTNGDGEIQFTEFWAWVCGHGTRQPHPLQAALLNMAIKQEENRLAAGAKMRVSYDETRRQKEREAATNVGVEAERAAGMRISQTTFQQQYMALGFNEDVARDLFRSADDDGNGELDIDELGALAASKVATIGQIKALVIRNIAKDCQDPDSIFRLIDMFSKWDTDGDGTISSNELSQVIQALNPELTEKTVHRLIEEVDEDGTGDVDILEFVSWLVGNPKKKKQQEEQVARVMAALHRHRHQEAVQMGKRLEFEEMQQSHLTQWCARSKIPLLCKACNTNSPWLSKCASCKGFHGWLCHGCGYVSFFSECVQGCPLGDFAWTCLTGACTGKTCGCKKKQEFWRRKGFAMNPLQISWSVSKQLETFKSDTLEVIKAADDEVSPQAEAEQMPQSS
mmetsp:Transcript_31389/g.61649  ORF Transcript_31389/g.61649 Transcript_31389/m.61649 type:complete len:454 (-) Transcript_31389:31-1392(-)